MVPAAWNLFQLQTPQFSALRAVFSQERGKTLTKIGNKVPPCPYVGGPCCA